MRAPKCKICEKEHWGVCYTPPANLKEKIEAAAKPTARAPAKRPVAKKTTKPKPKPKAKKP